MTLSIQWHPFSDLSVSDLYDALRLRQAVFVVEQNCVFLDADGLDARAIHGLGRDGAGDLVAVARILPPGSPHPMPSLGRIAVARHARGAGHGRSMVMEALAEMRRFYPHSPIHIHAQAHLERFYASLGFVRDGAPFDEDGIPHIAMRWNGRA